MGKSFVSPFSSSMLNKSEIGGMLEDMKIEILKTFSIYMDTLQIMKKREEIEKVFFFPPVKKGTPQE